MLDEAVTGFARFSLSSCEKIEDAIIRRNRTLYHRLHSIAHDSEFVDRVLSIYEQKLPIFANLRQGVWYICPRSKSSLRNVQQCYFKSTDGHPGTWAVSTRRLNFQVVEQAALSGGVMIIDATRAGKTFPDSLSRTIPLWATCINICCWKFHESRGTTNRLCGDEAEWTKLFSAPWISALETREMEVASHAAAVTFRMSNIPMENIVNRLCAPLRCLFCSPSSDRFPLQHMFEIQDNEEREWWELDSDTEEKLNGEYLESSSDDGTEEMVSIPSEEMGFGEVLDLGCLGEENSSTSTSSRRNPHDNYLDLDFTPIICVSASDQSLHEKSFGRFAYMPGAGDDEENWAMGLTSDLFWEYSLDILAEEEGSLADKIQEILQRSSCSSNPNVSVTRFNFDFDGLNITISNCSPFDSSESYDVRIVTYNQESFQFRPNSEDACSSAVQNVVTLSTPKIEGKPPVELFSATMKSIIPIMVRLSVEKKDSILSVLFCTSSERRGWSWSGAISIGLICIQPAIREYWARVKSKDSVSSNTKSSGMKTCDDCLNLSKADIQSVVARIQVYCPNLHIHREYLKQINRYFLSRVSNGNSQAELDLCGVFESIDDNFPCG